MTGKIIYQLDENDFQKAIEAAMQGHASNVILSRYEGRFVNSEVACEILNVSQRTLYRYIGAGLLKPETRNEKEEYRFDLRMLLEFNCQKNKPLSAWKQSGS